MSRVVHSQKYEKQKGKVQQEKGILLQINYTTKWLDQYLKSIAFQNKALLFFMSYCE